MKTDLINIKLTSLQASHAVVALQEYSKKLLSDAEKDPVGGEHEDYLIVQSIIEAISKAKE